MALDKCDLRGLTILPTFHPIQFYSPIIAMARPYLSFCLLICLIPAASSNEPPEVKNLPLKGDENVLFIGNSLTASLNESLHEMAIANGLPAFNGHRVQIWNETLEMHVIVSPEKTPEKFKSKNNSTQMKGYAIGPAFNSLWKKGVYDSPEFNDKGYITAIEAIQTGTPEGEPWDLVILQGYAANSDENDIVLNDAGEPTFEGPFIKYGAILIEEIKKAGAQPLLYMNWLLNPAKGGGNENPDSFYNDNFDRLIANYKLLSEHTGTPIIPVGHAMRLLSAEKRPDGVPVEWLIRDNVHGTSAGHALMHYCFAAALYGKPATELSYERESKSKWDKGRHYKISEKEDRYGIVITPEIDERIKEVAWTLVMEYCPWVNE